MHYTSCQVPALMLLLQEPARLSTGDAGSGTWYFAETGSTGTHGM